MQKEKKKQSVWSFIKETVILLVIAYVLAIVFQTYLYQPFKVEQGSMMPTLLENQRIFVSKIGYRFNEPARGDIVTLFSPKEPPYVILKYGIIPVKEKRTLVKRIIGFGGETLRIKAGKVYVDGKFIKETYVKLHDYSDFGPYKIPKNSVFVMGDNRAGSRDSRDLTGIGPVPQKNVLGKALIIYWPITKVRFL